MKIAMIGLKGIPASWGGVEKIVEAMSIELVRRGHEVTIYCRPYYAQTKRKKYSGVKLIYTPTLNTKHLDCPVHTLFSVLDALGRNFDIIHFHSIGPAIFCWLPRIIGKKTLVQIHGLGWTDVTWSKPVRFLTRLFEYPAVYLSDVFTTVSNPAVEYFKDQYKKKVYYLPSTTKFHKPRKASKIRELGLEKDRYLLYLARLTPQKGCHYLLKAFNGLDTDLNLVIAGGVDKREGLNSYVECLKRSADNRTIFLGFVYGELLEELFSNAYIYILPSETEGLSVALLEAMGYGSCVVTSNIPENRDAVQSYGYTFRNKDYKDLKDVLQKLIEHPELVKEKQGIAMRYVRKKYGVTAVVDTLEKLYKSMVE